MKIYNTPSIEVIKLQSCDVLTVSFGDLPEVSGQGTESPIFSFEW